MSTDFDFVDFYEENSVFDSPTHISQPSPPLELGTSDQQTDPNSQHDPTNSQSNHEQPIAHEVSPRSASFSPISSPQPLSHTHSSEHASMFPIYSSHTPAPQDVEMVSLHEEVSQHGDIVHDALASSGSYSEPSILLSNPPPGDTQSASAHQLQAPQQVPTREIGDKNSNDTIAGKLSVITPFFAPSLVTSGPLQHMTSASLQALRPPVSSRPSSNLSSTIPTSASTSTLSTSGIIKGPLARAVRDPTVLAALARLIASDTNTDTNHINTQKLSLPSSTTDSPRPSLLLSPTPSSLATSTQLIEASHRAYVAYPASGAGLVADLFVPLRHRHCVPVQPAPHVLSPQSQQQSTQQQTGQEQHLLLYGPARREPVAEHLLGFDIPAHIAIREHTYTRKQHIEVVKCDGQQDKPNARTLTRTIVHIAGDKADKEAIASRLCKQLLAMSAESVVETLLPNLSDEDAFIEHIWPSVRTRVRTRQLKQVWASRAQEEQVRLERERLESGANGDNTNRGKLPENGTVIGGGIPGTGVTAPDSLPITLSSMVTDISPRVEEYTLTQRLAEQEVLLRAASNALDSGSDAGVVESSPGIIKKNRALMSKCGCALKKDDVGNTSRNNDPDRQEENPVRNNREWGDALLVSPDSGISLAQNSLIYPAHALLIEELAKNSNSTSSSSTSDPTTTRALGSRSSPLPLSLPPLTPASLTALADLRRSRVRNAAHMLRQADAVVAVYVPHRAKVGDIANICGHESNADDDTSSGGQLGVTAYPLTVSSLKSFFMRVITASDESNTAVVSGPSSKAKSLQGIVYPLSPAMILLFQPRTLANSVQQSQLAKTRALEAMAREKEAIAARERENKEIERQRRNKNSNYAGPLGEKILNQLSQIVNPGNSGLVSGSDAKSATNEESSIETSSFNRILTSVDTASSQQQYAIPGLATVDSEMTAGVPTPSCSLCSLDSGVYSYLYACALNLSKKEGSQAYVVTLTGDAHVTPMTVTQNPGISSTASGKKSNSPLSGTESSGASTIGIVTVSSALEALVASTPIVDVVDRHRLLTSPPPHEPSICTCASVGCAHECALWEGVPRPAPVAAWEDVDGNKLTTNGEAGKGLGQSGDGSIVSAGAAAALRRMGIPVRVTDNMTGAKRVASKRTNRDGNDLNTQEEADDSQDGNNHSSGILPPLQSVPPSRADTLTNLSSHPPTLTKDDIAQVTDVARAAALQALIKRDDGEQRQTASLYRCADRTKAGPEDVGSVSLFELRAPVDSNNDETSWTPPSRTPVTMLLRVLMLGSVPHLVAMDIHCGDRTTSLQTLPVGALDVAVNVEVESGEDADKDLDSDWSHVDAAGSKDKISVNTDDSKKDKEQSASNNPRTDNDNASAKKPSAASIYLSAFMDADHKTDDKMRDSNATMRSNPANHERNSRSQAKRASETHLGNPRSKFSFSHGRLTGGGRTIAARIREFTRVYTRDMIRYRATRMLTNPQCLEAEGFNTATDKRRYWRHFLVPSRTHDSVVQVALALPAPPPYSDAAQSLIPVDSDASPSSSSNPAAAAAPFASRSIGGVTGVPNEGPTSTVSGIDVSKPTAMSSASTSAPFSTSASGPSASNSSQSAPNKSRRTVTLAQAWHEAHLPPAFLKEREARRKARAEALAEQQARELDRIRREKEKRLKSEGKKACRCHLPMRVHVMSFETSAQFWLDEALTRAAKQYQRYHKLSASATAQEYLSELLRRHQLDKEWNEAQAREMMNSTYEDDSQMTTDRQRKNNLTETTPKSPSAPKKRTTNPRGLPQPSSPASTNPYQSNEPSQYMRPDPLAPGITAKTKPRPNLQAALQIHNAIPFDKSTNVYDSPDLYDNGRSNEDLATLSRHRATAGDLPLETPWHLRQAVALQRHISASQSLISPLTSSRTHKHAATHSATASVARAARPLTFTAPLRTGLRNSQPLFSESSANPRVDRTPSIVSARDSHSPPPAWERSLSAWRSASTAALAAKAAHAHAQPENRPESPPSNANSPGTRGKTAGSGNVSPHADSRRGSLAPQRRTSLSQHSSGQTPPIGVSSSRRGSLQLVPGSSRRGSVNYVNSGGISASDAGASIASPNLSRRPSVVGKTQPNSRGDSPNSNRLTSISSTTSLARPAHLRTSSLNNKDMMLLQSNSQALLSSRGTLPSTVVEGDEPTSGYATMQGLGPQGVSSGVFPGWSSVAGGGHATSKPTRRPRSPPPSVSSLGVRPLHVSSVANSMGPAATKSVSNGVNTPLMPEFLGLAEESDSSEHV